MLFFPLRISWLGRTFVHLAPSCSSDFFSEDALSNGGTHGLWFDLEVAGGDEDEDRPDSLPLRD